MSEAEANTISDALAQASESVSMVTDTKEVEESTSDETEEVTEDESFDDSEVEVDDSTDESDEEDDISFDDDEENEEASESPEDSKRYSYERRQKEKAEKRADKLQEKLDKLEEQLASVQKESRQPTEVNVTNKTIDDWIDSNPDEWEEYITDFDEDTARALVKRDLKRDAKISHTQAQKEQIKVLTNQLNDFNDRYNTKHTLEDFNEINQRVSQNITLERLYQIDNWDKTEKEILKRGYELRLKDEKEGRNRLEKKKKAASVKRSGSPDASGKKAEASNIKDALRMAAKKVPFKK